jgi:hypothetical protein
MMVWERELIALSETKTTLKAPRRLVSPARMLAW